MPTERSILGHCPACATRIRASRSLVEYERDGEQAVYAECPRCREPVRPVERE